MVFEFLNKDEILNLDITEDKLMPFVHTTPAGKVKEILREKKLKKTLCTVFSGEELLYFFYARPAYRKVEQKTSRDSSLVPVVFIVKPDCAEIKRIYPFDSGGYEKYVNAHLSPLYKRSDYEMPNNFRAIQLYIKAIFGNNQKYFAGECYDGSELPTSIRTQREEDFCLNNLLNLIASSNKDDIDDRCMTIEIQSSIDYELSGKLLAIVVPDFFQDSPEFIGIMKEYSIIPEYYDYQHRFRANEFLGSVYEKVKKYYVTNNYL